MMISNHTAEGLSFGTFHVDWDKRVDYEKLRRDRLAKTRKAMDEADVDYLLLLRIENARYTTSVKRLYWPTMRFGGGPIIVLPRKDDPVVWIGDSDYAEKILTWLPKDRILEAPEMDSYPHVDRFDDQLAKMFGNDWNNAKIGVDVWSPAMYASLPKKFPNSKFVDGQEVMISARKTKTFEEIQLMKMAYAISQAGMQASLDILKPGVREGELLGECFRKFCQMGSETTQCSQVINSGPGTYPYRRFLSDRIIHPGEIVHMDFGACYSGYFGDFCRAFVCDGRPSREQKELLQKAHDGQVATVEALRPGISAQEVCNKLNNKYLAHGLGISAFEFPFLGKGTQDYVLEEGMIFAILQSVVNSAGLVHLEDNVVITKNGCELYSTFPHFGVD